MTYNSRGERTQLYNKLSGVTTAYRYDAAERLTSSGAAANPTNYRYNGDGVRVSKSTGLSSNSYVWDAGQDLLQDNTASYIYGPGGMLVEAVQVQGQSSTPYYYHADQLGSVRAITNSSGSVANTYTYDAYGNTTASTGTVANPFKYSGQYTDSESGFLYLRARYYDPATQQFLTVDPMLASTEQAYAYVGGSPVNGTDPSGLDANCSWWPNPFNEHSCIREGLTHPLGPWVVAGGAVVATGGIACVAGGCEALAGALGVSAAAAAAPEVPEIANDLAPAAGETCQFGVDDLVYGPSAGGQLRALANQAGGRLLNDLFKPVEMDIVEFSFRTLDKAASGGTAVRFDLTYVEDINGVLTGTGEYADTVTSQELRYIAANWQRFQSVVHFYENGKEVAPPWAP